jgi:hypothetical protein
MVPNMMVSQPFIEKLLGISLNIRVDYGIMVGLYFVIAFSIICLFGRLSTLKLISGVAKIIFSLSASIVVIYYTIDQRLSSNNIGVGLTLAVYAGLVSSVLTMISGYIDLLGLKDKKYCGISEYSAWVILIRRIGIGMVATSLITTLSCVAFLYKSYYMPWAEAEKAYSKIVFVLNIIMGLNVGQVALAPWVWVLVNSMIKIFNIVLKDLSGDEIVKKTYNQKIKDVVMLLPPFYLGCFFVPINKSYKYMIDSGAFVMFVAVATILIVILFNFSVSKLLDQVQVIESESGRGVRKAIQCKTINREKTIDTGLRLKK